MKTRLVLLCALVVATLTGCGEANSAEPEIFEDSVVINGVTWATSNVDDPGKFTKSSTAAGMFYQWNSRVGWSSTDPINSTWSVRPNEDSVIWEWTSENNPCPSGWRVPTLDEFKSLYDKNNVNKERVENPFGHLFTDKETGKSLYLRGAGLRWDVAGELRNVDETGCYWSAGGAGSTIASYVNNDGVATTSKGIAMPIRCVKE